MQMLLKKAAALDIRTICPLHGPILSENLDYYLNLYDTWSSYRPEDEGVFVACASIHGNTLAAAHKLVEKLQSRGIKTSFADLTRDDMAEAVEDAFRYDRMVVCASTYDGGVFLPAEDFIHHLKAKNYQKRTIGLVENGTWAPLAAKKMREEFEQMKEMRILDSVVTIRSVLRPDSEAQMDQLVEELQK